MRIQLIEKSKNSSVLAASAQLNIKYTTARNIVGVFKKTGRLYNTAKEEYFADRNMPASERARLEQTPVPKPFENQEKKNKKRKLIVQIEIPD